MTTQSMDIIHRSPFEGGQQAYSGAWFERGQLADGRSVILKHLPPDGDWLTRATDGLGRMQWLWESGLLDRVAATVDHAVLGLIREDGHDVLVMQDVGAWLFAADRRVAAADVGELLGGLAALHTACEGIDPSGLCTPAGRHSFATPAVLRSDVGPNPSPVGDVILRAWELFFEHVPTDVGQVVARVHDDLGGFGRALEEAAPPTLLHGDTKLDNLGMRDGRLVAIDWGELTGAGPAEMDLVWFAYAATTPAPFTAGWPNDAMPDELFRDYAVRSHRGVDDRALDLACIGQLAQVGSALAAIVHVPEVGPDDASRARASLMLDWWLTRVREAAERLWPA